MLSYITSHQYIRGLKMDGFFVGWPNPPKINTLKQILMNSPYIVLAVQKEDQKLVGFTNAITDGVLSAYIPLLEVLPDYQGQGVGKKLAQIMLKQLASFYMIDLSCDESVQSFYEQLGMQKSLGMRIRNYQFQAGKK